MRPKPEELRDLERIVEGADPALEVRELCRVAVAEASVPVYALLLGSRETRVPAVAFVGGVHGLERIGAQVVLACLRSLLERLRWDEALQRQLETLRLVFVPIANPGGLWLGTRANPNGVDLMRNAPVEAGARVPFLLGGQRLSRRLPWYRGEAGAPMEAESAALCDLLARELLPAGFSLVLDCHSGFGLRDRIWFPYAHTAEPVPHLPEIHALTELFDRAYPHHDYLIEPQSRQYLAHGDLWDHLYMQGLEQGRGPFLPLTLELGSWRWVKKHPRALLSRQGLFNPLLPHRFQRVLRRHLVLLDFLARAAASWHRWLPEGAARELQRRTALARWYRGSTA